MPPRTEGSRVAAYARRGWDAVRAEWPFAVVLLVLVVSIVYLIAVPGRWGRSAGGAAVAVLLAGILRVSVPDRRIGLLAVRGRVLDSVTYLLLGAIILAIDIRLHG